MKTLSAIVLLILAAGCPAFQKSYRSVEIDLRGGKAKVYSSTDVDFTIEDASYDPATGAAKVGKLTSNSTASIVDLATAERQRSYNEGITRMESLLGTMLGEVNDMVETLAPMLQAIAAAKAAEAANRPPPSTQPAIPLIPGLTIPPPGG